MTSYWTYFNPHPQGKRVNDCVKRAFVAATGKSYHEIKLEVNRIKKITKEKDFNSKKNYKYYVEKILKGVKISFPARLGEPRMTGKKFVKLYSKGIYILNLAHHLVTVVDGQILDTWDSSDKCVYNCWKIMPEYGVE